ncbi:MAG: hypothetical protein VYB72_08625 [Planctomycetota bacterium]|nr:hypothetical protein [Planctomycetota bacterium]
MKNSEILRILMPERTKQIALAWSILRSAELFGETDQDSSRNISYLEFSHYIYYSPKHGSDAYRKADQDQSKSLDIQECATDLHKRKSHRKYFQANGSGWVGRSQCSRDDPLHSQRDS